MNLIRQKGRVMKTVKFTPAEREFLEMVSDAAFANPFSDDRIQLNLRLSGMKSHATSEKILEGLIKNVAAFLEKLEQAGKDNPKAINAEERPLLENAHLFNIFHKFMYQFDELIQEQIKAREDSSPVPFANESLSLLKKQGFTADSALKYFAMFYQLRRAFFFINISLIGQCRSMQQLRESLWNNVFTHDMRLYDKHLWNRMEDFSTLVLGETGTGKGAAARAIGRSGFIPFHEKSQKFSESFMRSFVAINLSQFTESLIESELFGHKKGAFTGAIEAHEGVFARCSPHGAIFLDEIGDVATPIQIRLLQVLQEREFSPVGSHEKHRFHGRVIAASNRPIDELREKGLFRDDFFYRLCSDVIVVPPLAQRLKENPEEIEELLSLITQRITGRESQELTSHITEVINQGVGKKYNWPGNVRELEQCARRVLLTNRYDGDKKTISTDLLTEIQRGIKEEAYDAQRLVSDYCALLYDRHGTYEEVARRAGLDRRTAKKHISSQD